VNGSEQGLVRAAVGACGRVAHEARGGRRRVRAKSLVHGAREAPHLRAVQGWVGRGVGGAVPNQKRRRVLEPVVNL
jgi:hypothetical protein